MPFDSEQGFVPTTREEFVEMIKTQITKLWGNLNFNDLSDLGIINTVSAELLYHDQQTFLDFFNQTFIQTAEGSILEKRLKDFYFERREPTHSLVNLKIKGKKGNTVSKGFLVSSNTGVSFQTLKELTLTHDDYHSVSAQSVDVGSHCNVLAHSITNIESSASYVYGVDNESGAVGGLDRETDEELRKRFYEQSGELSSNQIINGLQMIQDVGRVFVVENYTDSFDNINKIPAHSVELVIDGGADLDIAQFILNKAPFGVKYYGDTTVAIPDVSNIMRSVSFSRPSSLDVFVTIDVKRVEDTFDRDEFLSLAKEIITNYINNYNGDTLADWKMMALFNNKVDVLDMDFYFSTNEQEKGSVWLKRPVKNIFTTAPDKIKLGNLTFDLVEKWN